MAENIKRNYMLDNIKLFLIILVVFGHCMEMMIKFHLIPESVTAEALRAWIYSFHMPAFIFISGYFSKNSYKSPAKLLSGCLIPYLIFNTAYDVILSKSISVNIFVPKFAFWYLLCLFFWRISVVFLKKLNVIGILFIFALSIYAGLIKEADTFLSVQRAVAFYPFFVMGYYSNEKTLAGIRKIPKPLTALALTGAGVFTVLANINNRIPTVFYENRMPYKEMDLTFADGIIMRLITFAVSFVIIICLINLTPQKEFSITKYGQRTASIYLLHPFLILLFVDKILPLIKYNLPAEYAGIAVVLTSAAMTVCIIFLCANRFISKIFGEFLDFISKIFINL